ncbi:MAG: DUF971 domain-containing protein [Deltaproteobacteria bacterium]|nr:DUF971 domain-containing protein [Deltaproteobacteria bacterium]
MSGLTTQSYRPTTIKRVGTESLEVVWDDAHHSIYPNRYLRDNCPCAACREGKPMRFSLPVVASGGDLHPTQIGVVGRYAINIQWSDGHDTGIYSYETLRQLCRCDLCQRPAPRSDR